MPVRGAITALITPFFNGKIDFEALGNIINHQINAGINQLVFGGSTGELSSLSDKEYANLLQEARTICVKAKMIAGCSVNNTYKAVEIAKVAESKRADLLMCSVPYYNKPTQEGIYQHFKIIHDNTELPIILYSVPSRTGTDFTDETIIKLAELERVVALKDASGDIERPLRIKKKIGNKITLLCGEDTLMVAFNANGGEGCISATSNFIPSLVNQVQDLCLKNNFNQALKIQLDILNLCKVMFCESNPIPIKYAMHKAGFCHNELRLPLCPLSQKNQELVEKVIKTYISN